MVSSFPDPVSDQTLLFIGRPTCSVLHGARLGPEAQPRPQADYGPPLKSP